MKNKMLSLLLVSAMAIIMLAGCVSTKKAGKPADSTTNQDTANEEEAFTTNEYIILEAVSMFGGTDPNASAYEEINEVFQSKYSNVALEDNSQSSDQYWKATIAADFAVGNEPDVIQYFTDVTAKTVLTTDKFVSIDEIKAEYPDYAKDTTEVTLDAVKNPDGVRRAVPTTGYWEGLFCNKDLFESNNVEIPTDWDSLVKAIETFQANDIIPIAVSMNKEPNYWVEYVLLYSAGVESYCSIPETTPAEWVKGLEVIKTLRDMGAFPVDTDTIDNAFAQKLFHDKKAAMSLDGSWAAGNITDTDNVVIVGFPGVPAQKAEANTVVSGLSTGFYITRKAWKDPDKKEAAVNFVMAHTCKEGVRKYWEATGKIQVAAVELEVCADLSPMGRSAMEFIQKAPISVLPTDARLGAEPYSVIIANMSKISAGSVNAEEVITEALMLYKELNEE
ncbi:extracellular solute-binding protein [Lachnospiraceae bacterium ZAX-1]